MAPGLGGSRQCYLDSCCARSLMYPSRFMIRAFQKARLSLQCLLLLDSWKLSPGLCWPLSWNGVTLWLCLRTKTASNLLCHTTHLVTLSILLLRSRNSSFAEISSVLKILNLVSTKTNPNATSYPAKLRMK